ncbi:MAG: response regulator transcription factor [Firmicutes bacterium]|nr:response regulator transcription factor [Bacillota bacterium]MCL5039917.1 response regulator transcription factor [Bacillota bacterium]
MSIPGGPKILVVDDEAKIVDLVRAYLEKDGYRVIPAYDGKTALELAKREKPALVILDLMLPEMSGLDVCRQLRASSNISVIMLTARDDETDKLIGLELGADDYITKPFSPKEVVARVRAVLRRVLAAGAANPQDHLSLGDITIDFDAREVTVGDTPVELTPTEFNLLGALARHHGRTLTRLQLLDAAMGEAFEGYERTIDTHIKNLRRKIEKDPSSPTYIQTVYGVGYRFTLKPANRPQ